MWVGCDAAGLGSVITDQTGKNPRGRAPSARYSGIENIQPKVGQICDSAKKLQNFLIR